MGVGDGVSSIEIRNGAGQLEDALPRPPGEAQMPHGAIEQRTGPGLQCAIPLDLSVAQTRVAAGLARELPSARGRDAGGECRARFPSTNAIVEIADFQPRNLYVHVETVEQGA